MLAGVGHTALVAFLVATYAAWAFGLRANLAANWALLDRTGASTSIASKLLHDVAAARGAGTGRRRVAAAAGYVGTEVLKELPYYGGAFAATLTDSVDSGEALIFLGGANLGAAAYECTLARLTRLFLRRRKR